MYVIRFSFYFTKLILCFEFWLFSWFYGATVAGIMSFCSLSRSLSVFVCLYFFLIFIFFFFLHKHTDFGRFIGNEVFAIDLKNNSNTNIVYLHVRFLMHSFFLVCLNSFFFLFLSLYFVLFPNKNNVLLKFASVIPTRCVYDAGT